MMRVFLMSLVCLAGAAFAEVPVIAVPELLSEAEAARLLSADPGLRAAEAEAEAGLVEARQTAASPYEWTASYSRQQRDYGVGPSSEEWNVGIERTWRLPGKAQADAASSEAALAAAGAARRLARRDAAQALLGRWLDWLEARGAEALLREERQAVAESVAAVGKRVRSGDAAPLERGLADAELGDVERQLSAAQTRERAARAQLAGRYGIEPDSGRLPEPVAVAHDGPWWQRQIESASDRLRLAEARDALARAGLERAKAERIPDPTIGVYTGREAYGQEKLVGISFSIPIPGSRRGLEVERQSALAGAARDTLALTRRAIGADAQALHAAAVGHYQRWQLARASAKTLRDNARLMQKAYALGEQDLQALLLARRQSLAAEAAEEGARADALRAYYALLLDARLLWRTWLDGDGEAP